MSSGLSVSLCPPTGVYGNFWIPCVPSLGFGEPGPLNTTLARLMYLARAPSSWGFNTNAGFWREGNVGIEVLPCSQESNGQALLLGGILSVGSLGGQGPTYVSNFPFSCLCHFFLLPGPEQLSTFSPGANVLYVTFKILYTCKILYCHSKYCFAYIKGAFEIPLFSKLIFQDYQFTEH